MDILGFTVTYSANKYSDDRTEEEIMEFVRHAHNDEDALHNLRIELKEYDKRKTVWQLIRMIFNK